MSEPSKYPEDYSTMRNLVYHIFARERYWTPKQVDSLKLSQMQSELLLLREDIEARKPKS